ncbi:MAG TPA: CC/Se motif family (seleno)protein [Bacteroidales bacterium]|nr:CC/Se motif family (seleno)protein [Bacteroidales bacterium]
MVQLHCDETTKNWIKKREKEVTISLLDPVGCCAGVVELVAKWGAPKDLKRYEIFHLDEDLTIYVQKNLPLRNNELTLKLSGIGPFKFLSPKGIAPLM